MPKGQETTPRTVLNTEQLGTPGLYLMGHGFGKRAELPLISHAHRQRMEFLLVLSGSLPYTCGDADYTLFGGDGLFVRQGTPHASGEVEDPETELLWFQLDPEEENFLALPALLADRLRERLQDFDACQFTLPAGQLRQFKEAFGLLCRRDLEGKGKGQMLFCYCLMNLLDSKVTRLPVHSEAIRAIRHYIKAHIRETIDMDELLLAANLSYRELRQRCREELNCDPREYILRCKLEDARRPVACSNRSFGGIAFSYGFSSAQYFNVKFRKYTGYSPAKYRKLYRQGKLQLPE